MLNRISNLSFLRRLLATTGVFVTVGLLLFTGCDTTVNEEGDPIGGDTTDASTTINNPPPGSYDVSGNVTGRVVDRATNEPLDGVAVTIDAVSVDEEPLSDTTDASGEFAFTDVPAQESESGGANGDYTLHFNTEGVDGNYRDNLRVETTLQFGDNQGGGDGDPNGVSASVTLPLAELSASLSAKGYVESDATGARIPAEGVPVTLKRRDVLEFDASGSSNSSSLVEVATDTTASDGSFEFNNIPEGLQSFEYDFVWQLGNQRVTSTPVTRDIPLSGEGNTNVHLGELDLTAQVQNSMPFQITDGPQDNNPDLDTQDPTFTFTFNRPVAQNDFTDAANLADELEVDYNGAKALDPDGDPTLDVSFNGDRTEMTIGLTEGLRDGARFEIEGIDDIFSSSQFVDADFEQTPDEVDGLPNYSSLTSFNFSVGVDQTQPGAPKLTRTDNASFDIESNTLSFDLRVADTSSVALCQNCNAVEIWASTEGTSAERVETVSGPIEYGDVNVSVSLGGEPLRAPDGSYTPVEVYAVVQSLNEVKSDASDRVTITDATPPGVDQLDTSYDDVDGDGDDELLVTLDEPVDKETVELSDFTITDGSNTASTLDSIAQINYDDVTGETQITIELDQQNDPNSDELEVTGITDLAGNGIDTGDNTDTSL